MNSGMCSGEPVAVEEQVEGELSLNDLPDEILILIFNRLFDLKCLCLCSLVSPRFSSLILHHVHSVSFAVPRRTATATAVSLPTPSSDSSSNKLFRFFIDRVIAKPFQYFRQFVFPAADKPLPSMISSFLCDSFRYAIYFLSKFKSIRSLHLILPSSDPNPNPNDNDSPFFKWTGKVGTTINTFAVLSASSIRPANVYDDEPEQAVEEEEDLERTRLQQRGSFAFQCLEDAIIRHQMLLFAIEEHPLLQNMTITDSMNQGNISLSDSNLAEMRNWIKSELKKIEVPVSTDSKNQGNLSLRDSKLAEMRNWVDSARRKIHWGLKNVEIPVRLEKWHVPILELPVSGKVMKSATLVLMEIVDRSQVHRDLGGAAAAIANLFEKGEEEFGEAIVEMMVNHQSTITVFD